MSSVDLLESKIDAVVFLTMSDWKTELRSNRYHYATRFAHHFKVIFVQPDLISRMFEFEETEHSNISILHVYANCIDGHQVKLLSEALNSIGIISPLLWIYNPNFYYYIKQAYSPLKIYHATEDYFAKDYAVKFEEDSFFLKALENLLISVDKVFCVSDGVKQSLLNIKPELIDRTEVITNGCDYEFYAEQLIKEIDTSALITHTHKIAFYQGNIYSKLDFDMICQAVIQCPDWIFQFCGPVVAQNSEWKKLLTYPNFQYLGILSPEEIRSRAYNATVGIIPFVTLNFLKGSFPLKTFEYIACGLPVVSTPISALAPFSDLIDFVTNPTEFIEAIRLSEQKRFDKDLLQKRLLQASKQAYNKKFDKVIGDIAYNLTSKKMDTTSDSNVLKILVLYEPKSLRVSTIEEHLSSFGKYSAHQIKYAPATNDFSVLIDTTDFDVIVIHYSIRLSVSYGLWTISPHIVSALRGYSGLKVLFIQDEYDQTNIAKEWIAKLGIQMVFTCVPESDIREVYYDDFLRHVDFINNLTGYVPDKLITYPTSPISERKMDIAYRGRNLPFWYGNLGQEKEYIGIRMKDLCFKNGLLCDIEWKEEKRIYGDGWYKFLASAKSTLGTESGSGIFDYSGAISQNVTSFLEKNPKASYEEVFATFLAPYEGQVRMNQISPKIFEAICLRTALVLFEGTYSGVIEPHKHYIPLKKDFSNIDEVVMKVKNVEYLESMIQTAYQDIIESEEYSYKNFIKAFDKVIGEKVKTHVQLQTLQKGCGIYYSDTPIPITELSKSKFETINLGQGVLKFTFNNFCWNVFNVNLLKLYRGLHKNIPLSRPVLQFAKKMFLNKKNKIAV